MYRFRIFSLIVISLCSIFILTSWAANDFKRWNSQRDYEPIILQGSEFSAFLGDPVSHLFAYSYDAISNQWTQTPLQIDEVDDSLHVWNPSPNKVLNSRDEIIFMARDMGDRIPENSLWIDDDDSKNNERFEIVATDSLDGNKQAFLYLYQSATLNDLAESYVNVTENSGDLYAYTIQGISYIEKHNDDGISKYWEIPTLAGGNGQNLLDRQKIRLDAMILFLDINMTEDDLLNSSIERVAGKIRIAERAISSNEFYSSPVSIRIPTYYYPYSIHSNGASDIFEDTGPKVLHIRNSFDLNSNANAMLFHNNLNNDIPIDGGDPTADDTIHTDLVFNPDVNWQMVTGNQGTIVTLRKIDAFGNDSLYFYDRAISNQGADGKEDTGDKQSWGDAGIKVKGSDLEDRFTFPYTSYFLSENQPATLGVEFANNLKKPLSISVNSKPVPVELAIFKATLSEGNIILEWTTSSETNNYGFEIQRKYQNETEWHKVNFINGNGTSSIPHHYSFVDQELRSGSYFYRLKQIDFGGAVAYSYIIEVTITVPDVFALGQNYPNPFNPTTKISYQIPGDLSENETVHLTIYNLLGIPIKTLVNENQTPGYHTIYWDSNDEQGNVVPTGIYIYRLQAGKYIAMKRMVLMK